MKSLLQKRLRDLDEINTTVKNQRDVNTQLLDAGDAFELAARCALGAWEARQGREVTTEVKKYNLDSFELGYKTAAAELALILRAMRKGSPPDKTELEEIQKELEKEILNDG